MKGCALLVVFLIVILLNFQSAFPLSSDEINALEKGLGVLKEGQKAIQKDIQEIKKILEAKQAPAEFEEVIINIQGAPSKGDGKADLALIEFSDYQ